MKKELLLLVFLSICGISFSQIAVPFNQRYETTQKGGITFVTNASIKCDGTGGGGLFCSTLDTQTPPTALFWSQNNDHGSEYIDIDSDLSTFSSSADSLQLATCSEILFAEIYWGANRDDDDTHYDTRDEIKIDINGGGYTTVVSDTLIDNTVGYISYHCRADITDLLKTAPLQSKITVANIYSNIDGTNNWAGWNIVVVYKNDLETMKNLTVYDGIANVSGVASVDITVDGFLTPPLGAVNFDIGVFAYDGDRGFTGDQLQFDGGGGFVNISNATNPSTDIFNFSITNGGVVSTSQDPLIENNICIDSDIFRPDNSGFAYIGNSASTADIRVSTTGETILTQVVTMAIDVYEPDIRSSVTVVDLNGGDAFPGDTLEYTIKAINIGSDPSINTVVTDTLEGNIDFVPESIEITFGPNSGTKTDASADDQAEFDDVNKVVIVRIGTGADGTDGGEVLNDPLGIDSTKITFLAVVSENCALLDCDNVVNNQAFISGVGPTSGHLYNNGSNPGVFDGDGCPISGTTETPINTSFCLLPSDTTIAQYCAAEEFIDLPYIGYTYYDDTFTEVTTADGSGTYYAIQEVYPGCADTIAITITDFGEAPTASDAGSDESICEDSPTTTLDANSPVIGTGLWTVVSGSGTFDDDTDPTTDVSGLSTGENIFAWTIINLPCPETSSDTVVITLDEEPTVSAAGSDQSACVVPGTATLAGNNPAIGTGAWTVIAGSATVTDPTAFDSGVTGLSVGANTFRWTISNGACTASFDEITITGIAAPTTSNAGGDQTVCIDPGTATLAGNDPAIGTGVWTVTAGGATITDDAAFNSGVTGLTVGTNTFRWTISNGSCTDSFDEITINVDALPTTATAGSDQTVCIDPGIATLAGNDPAIGTGVWTVTAGGAAVTDDAAFNSGVTGLTVGTNTFRWTISNGSCSDSFDEITINVDALPTTATAGSDQTVCVDPGTATLAGNNPAIGTGLWTVIAGGASITDDAAFNSGVTGLTVGANTFRWTISNGTCSDSFDEITINVDELPTTANAGSDEELCELTSTDLDGNDPAVGTGVWTVIAGGGTVTDPSLLTRGVTGLSMGVNTFRWTISNGTCSDSFDEVDIIVFGDNDEDGICDNEDLDDDNDGITDVAEGDGDSDGDGIPDSLDLDSDNDGIPDLVEAGGTDIDGDGIVDDLTDTDGDGLVDIVDEDDGGTPLTNPDSDGDGIPDATDLDSDNDGTPDIVEAGGIDTDGDGVIDDLTDTDGDGFADLVDTDDNTVPGPGDGGTALTNPDTDNDGVDDRLDLDSDNDGIPDVIENGGTDADGDGVLDDIIDTDGDGFADEVDTDDNTVPGPGDGGTNLPGGDADMDGIPNNLDLDSDNDGILDIVEAGGVDTDSDGTIDDFTDIDGDGYADVVDTDDNSVPGPGDGGTALTIPNTDGTGGPDYLDIDADGDGIVDNIEGQSTEGYMPPTGIDTDGDGIDDAYDIDEGGAPIGDYDHDGDDTPDYLDLDSDNDGESDLIEGHDTDGDGTPDTVPTGTDSDGDGLDDAFDTIVLTDLTSGTNAGNGTIDPLTDGVLADADNPGVGNLDFRELDTDGDGIDDAVDLDDDNDGIPDLAEGDGDSDGDGIPDSLDLDSDNDGIPDLVEAGGIDTDGDGIVDDLTDTDGDGLVDIVDEDDGGTPLTNPDSDGDGIPDATDLDSDNDGTPDIVEAGGIDTDGDGVIDDLTDTDGDGFADLVDTDDNTVPGPGDGGTALTNPDTDNDGVDDRLDLDSDNDGIPDVTENGGTDADGDGVLDDIIDTDGDGFADEVDTDDNTVPGPGDGGTNLPGGDADMDGIPNNLDLDSDNDGILDIIEAGGVDTDSDGTIDDFTDIDGDGYADVVDTDDNSVPGPGDGGTALTIPNTDGTGGPDYLDIDADGDGIVDNIEGQSTEGYTPPNGTDTDGDGIDDAYDIDEGGAPIGDYDHDGDGTPDYQDLDSDNDGESDLIEGHDTDGDGTPDTVPTGTDSDGDGLDDAFDTIVLTDLTSGTNAGNGTIDPLTDGVLADADNPGVGNLDFRELDTDGDGIDDAVDLDDDNDGIPDLAEGNGDTDGDGIPDHLDLDSDNDGIPDIVEAGGIDENGDGRVDDLNEDGTLINDTNNDGLDDLYDSDNGGEDIPNPDTDGDGNPDFQDLDSDNDGIFDRVEDGGVDEDGDGKVDDWSDEDGDGIPDYADVDQTEGTDVDGDGIDDSVQIGEDEDGDGIADDFDEDANGDGWDDDDATDGSEDTDGDGVEDRLDLDSDNDGTPDIIEDGGTDENGDGKIDDFNDEDGDGADDDDMTDGLDDSDGDGVPDHEDLDSDNDGITDAEENGIPDENGDGVIDDFNDEDGDGWDDDDQTTVQVDTDGDGNPDDTDLDSDDDGIDDIIEGGGVDEDGDGTIDDFTDENGDGLDDDGGSSPPDSDGDGIDDYQDTDSDNDEIPDVVENDPNGDGTGPDDTDGDGIPDYIDTDDDNDGIPTIDEGDEDGDGELDDCDEDGIPDYLDSDPCSNLIPTGFSPNNDGYNDYFVINGIENNPNVTVVIFNRWGSKVYESNGYQNDWDGTNQFGMTTGSRDLPDGTYFYVIDLGDGSDPIRNYVQIQR